MQASAPLSTSLGEAIAGYQHYQELFEHAAEGYIVTNPGGTIWEVNRVAAELLHASQDYLMGRPLAVLVAREDQRMLRKYLVRLRNGDVVDGLEIYLQPNHGRPFPALLKANAILDAKKRVTAESWLVRDISLRKRIEVELARSNALLTALGHVAMRIETTADASKVMDTLGQELRRLDLYSFVALLEPDEQSLIVRHFSTESDALAMVERLLGVKAVGFRLLRERFILYRDVVEGQRPLFVIDWLSVIAAMLPNVPRAVIERAGRLLNVTSKTRVIYLPLKADEQVLGVIGVWGNSLQEQDLTVLSIFAGQVAIALKNAQLYAQVRSAHERLRQLACHVISVQDEERQRVSRELHDEAGQSLTALRISLQLIGDDLPGDCGSFRQRIQEIACLADRTLEGLRLLAHNLRPPVLDALGLNATLENQCSDFARHTGLAIEYHGVELPLLPGVVSMTFYRYLQEALTNVAKHAHASCVAVDLNVDGKTVTLTIEDDGQGLDRPVGVSANGRVSGVGLLGLKERFELLGGRLEISSCPRQGTRLAAWVPLREAQ
jgi:PAS domain S-box-containing protein